MGTSPSGIPYPEDADPVAQGAQAMKAIALKTGTAASGTTTLALPTPNTSATVAVTFPAGRFTAPPIVMLARQTGYGATATTYYWPTGISATGFTLSGVSTAAGGTATIGWLAVQAP